jgi:heat shock protein HtpX
MTLFKRFGYFIIVNLLILLMIGIVFSIITAVFGLRIPNGYQGLLFFCAVMGFGGSFFSLMLSKWIAKTMWGVQVIDPSRATPEMRELVHLVHGLAAKAGLQKMPEVGIYQSPEINAFATGPSKNNSLIAVSSGLLQAMNHDEIEGVLGHEITHVANGDMVTLTLIQGVLNTFVFFIARVLANVIVNSGNDRDRRGGSPFMYFVIVRVLDICFGILAAIVVNFFSRQREFRADRGGALYAGREKMLAGLRKLQTQFQALEPDNSAVAAFKITSRSGGWMSLFASHPPLEERIQRLEQMKDPA